VLESLMQPCDKVSKRWKVSCIVTAKNSKFCKNLYSFFSNFNSINHANFKSKPWKLQE
jgi:hypothetical protein